MLIADIGAVPYIAIKSNVKPKSHGYPALNRMVNNMYRENPDDYAKHYNRRSIIEGIFSAMKRRMQSSVRSRIIRWWRHYAEQQFGMQYPWHTI